MPKKKKAKKTAPTKKAKKFTRKKVIKKAVRAKAAPKKKLPAVKAAPKEKLLGKVEHYFDKIMVAAISVKAPFAVGDILHIKGHTTDFVERLESMQIEHQNVAKVKKGDDVGIKVKGLVREHDLVYLSNEKALTAPPVQPAAAKTPRTFTKPQSFQQAMFPALDPPKPAAAKSLPPAPAAPKPAPQPKPQAQPKADPYDNKKFFSF